MEDQINIYDIAKMAGVSIATVSRVVNGSARVSQKTRDKVMAVIEGAGYTPNVFAQGLGLNTMHTVGILVPTIADMYMSSAVAYLEDALHNAGYDCLLSCSGFLADQKENHLRMMLSKRVDAMILVGSTYAGSEEETHNTDYIRVAAEKVPMFLINGLVDGENIYCTASNDYQASFDVTQAMVESGRDKILFLTDSRSYSANQKKKGYPYEKLRNGSAFPAEEPEGRRFQRDLHHRRRHGCGGHQVRKRYGYPHPRGTGDRGI